MKGLDASEIRFSELPADGSNSRTDPEFFSKRFIENEAIVRKAKFPKFPLVSLTTKIDVGHVGSMAHEYSEKGVILLQTQNIQQFLINYSDCVRVSQHFHDTLKKSQIFSGDCLIARSGSIGNAAFVTDLDPQPLNSADIIIVRPDSNKITNGYLAAFLNSKIGALQIERYSSGGVQGHINLKAIEHVCVPLLSKLFQESIDRTVRDGMSTFRSANDIYESANKTLIEALGLKDWRPPEPLTYTRAASEIFAASRMDAEHFQPKYRALLAHARKCAVRVRRVQEFAAHCERGEQPEYYDDGTLSVITSKHILETGLDYENFARTREDYWTNIDFVSARIFQNDILTYTTGAKVGRTAAYLSDERALASNHVNVLRVREENPVYVSVAMNSMIGRWQTRMCVTGSAQVELYPNDIRSFSIPFVDPKTEAAIVSAVHSAHAARAKASELLKRAKRAVEIAIEQDEKAALDYLNSGKQLTSAK